jgi:hypothetical protein
MNERGLSIDHMTIYRGFRLMFRGSRKEFVLGLLSSATFWAMFGLILTALSKLRRLKARRRLASD